MVPKQEAMDPKKEEHGAFCKLLFVLKQGIQSSEIHRESPFWVQRQGIFWAQGSWDLAVSHLLLFPKTVLINSKTAKQKGFSENNMALRQPLKGTNVKLSSKTI